MWTTDAASTLKPVKQWKPPQILQTTDGLWLLQISQSLLASGRLIFTQTSSKKDQLVLWHCHNMLYHEWATILKLQSFLKKTTDLLRGGCNTARESRRELFSVPLNSSLTPALSVSWGNRMQKEWVLCGKYPGCSLTSVQKPAVVFCPSLACLTDHSRWSALLHQIMDPDSGGGPPLYIEPSFLHVPGFYMNVCSGMQSAQLYCVWLVKAAVRMGGKEVSGNKSSHLKFMTDN